MFVDQSSSRRLEKIGEDSPSSPEVIGAHTLNFRPKFKLFLCLTLYETDVGQRGYKFNQVHIGLVILSAYRVTSLT